MTAMPRRDCCRTGPFAIIHVMTVNDGKLGRIWAVHDGAVEDGNEEGGGQPGETGSAGGKKEPVLATVRAAEGRIELGLPEACHRPR